MTQPIPSSSDREGATRGLGFPIFRSTWRADVLARATSLWSDVKLIVEGAPVGSAKNLAQQVEREIELHLQRAAEVATNGLPRLRRGGAIATCYHHLHEAEALMGEILPPDQLEATIPHLVAKASHLLDRDDGRLKAIEALREPPQSPTAVFHPERQARFVAGLRLTYGIADLTFGQVRRLRNNVVVATCVLIVVVASAAVAGYLSPEGLPLCALHRTDIDPPSTIVACPTQEQEIPNEEASVEPRQPDDVADHWDVAFVALFGLMGATLSGALGVSRTRPRSDTPYDLPLYYFLLKLPTGSLTAIVGLFLVNGEFIPGLTALDTQAQILGYAVLFGAAQHYFTRWIDRSAQDLLNALPGRSPAGAAPASTSTAGGRSPRP